MVLEEASMDTVDGASIAVSILPARPDLNGGEECLRASDRDGAESGADNCDDAVSLGVDSA